VDLILNLSFPTIGAGLVFVLRGDHRKFLDTSLGFAGGVMMAASFWSLLTPAIDRAEESGYYGEFNFVPVTIGFLLGALFCYGTDVLISRLGTDPMELLALHNSTAKNYNTDLGQTNPADVNGASREDHEVCQRRMETEEKVRFKFGNFEGN
jgi:zinc transporter ZupT